MYLKNMKKFIFLILFFLFQVVVIDAKKIIRSFDLGGSGLKTSLFEYVEHVNHISTLSLVIQLGKCPDDQQVSDWIRLSMIAKGLDLDREIKAGYLFGFSLAGLNKLRSKVLETDDIAQLFNIPAQQAVAIDDGSAHLIASLGALDRQLPEGIVWNFAIGSGLGIGCTDKTHQIKEQKIVRAFFESLQRWSCPTKFYKKCFDVAKSEGFDLFVARNGGVIDDVCFKNFSKEWRAFLEKAKCYVVTKKLDLFPKAIVFTGGFIDEYQDILIILLDSFKLDIAFFKGPKNAGLLGAAWHVVHTVLNKKG